MDWNNPGQGYWFGISTKDGSRYAHRLHEFYTDNGVAVPYQVKYVASDEEVLDYFREIYPDTEHYYLDQIKNYYDSLKSIRESIDTFESLE